MKLKLVCLIFSLVFASSFLAQASVYEVAYEPATAFFKSPESLFVSGYASKSDLLSQTRQSFTNFTFEASVGNKTVQVQNEQILREINVAWKVQVKKVSPLYSQADLTSRQLVQLKEDQLLEIESLEGAFARVKHSALTKGYILISSLAIPDQDPGQWVNMLPLSLKFEPKSNSKQKLLVPAMTRLSLIKVENGFGLFSTGQHKGYAALSDVVGRSDFAELGYSHETHQWEKVLYRTGADVIVAPNRKLSITKFAGFRSHKNRALISGDHATLSRGTRVELVKPQAIRWTQSEIKGHGLVWWRRDLLADTFKAETITTAELMRRNLSGISYDSKSKKGLASAGGIFKTVDGKTWKKVSHFGSDDWPVCIHPSGVWFVGAYRSTDEGKTFEPALKYTDLAKLLQAEGKRNRAFIHLKVLDLEALPKSKVMMKIDTGVTVAKLTSHVLSNNWTVQE